MLLKLTPATLSYLKDNKTIEYKSLVELLENSVQNVLYKCIFKVYGTPKGWWQWHHDFRKDVYTFIYEDNIIHQALTGDTVVRIYINSHSKITAFMFIDNDGNEHDLMCGFPTEWLFTDNFDDLLEVVKAGKNRYNKKVLNEERREEQEKRKQEQKKRAIKDARDDEEQKRKQAIDSLLVSAKNLLSPEHLSTLTSILEENRINRKAR